MLRPRMIVVAGPPGSGKTRFFPVTAFGIDGFNISRVVTLETLEDFVDLVVPILQERGIYKRDYAEGTLREKLFGQGQALLPDRHPGALYRRPGQSLHAAE